MTIENQLNPKVVKVLDAIVITSIGSFYAYLNKICEFLPNRSFLLGCISFGMPGTSNQANEVSLYFCKLSIFIKLPMLTDKMLWFTHSEM